MTALLSIEEIERLEQLEKAATPGEWSVRPCEPGCKGEHICTCVRDSEGRSVQHTRTDQALIAAMRNALPQLLRAAREHAATPHREPDHVDKFLEDNAELMADIAKHDGPVSVTVPVLPIDPEADALADGLLNKARSKTFTPIAPSKPACGIKMSFHGTCSRGTKGCIESHKPPSEEAFDAADELIDEYGIPTSGAHAGDREDLARRFDAFAANAVQQFRRQVHGKTAMQVAGRIRENVWARSGKIGTGVIDQEGGTWIEEHVAEAVATEREALLAKMKSLDLDRLFHYDQPQETQDRTWSACMNIIRARSKVGDR